MMTSANSSDSKLLTLYFCCLREPPYWMLFPVMVDTKLCEGSMSSRFFVREQSTPIICTRHTPSVHKVDTKYQWKLMLKNWKKKGENY